MNVRQLKEVLKHCNDNAVVYIANPNMFATSAQEAHTDLGVRLLISDNEEVWFETYYQENIGDEIEAIAQAALEENWSDEDYVDTLLTHDHCGYTMEDIRENAPKYYEWLLNNKYRKEMYPMKGE